MGVILGIDPGLQHTGWGIIESRGNSLSYVACGSISTNPKQEIAARILHLNQELSKIISFYQPQQAAIEETFVNKNASSSLKLGHARGALMLTVSLAGLPVNEYAATLVKKSVVGVGRAEKDQVIMMVKRILPSAKIESEDAADALAVAVCHANHAQIRKLMGAGVRA